MCEVKKTGSSSSTAIRLRDAERRKIYK